MPDAALFHPLLLAFVVPPNLSASTMLNIKPLLLKDTAAPARSMVAIFFLLYLKFERLPGPPADPKAFTLGTYGGDIQKSFARFSLEDGPARTFDPPF